MSDIEIIRRVHFNTSGDTKEGRSVLLMEFLLKESLLQPAPLECIANM